MNLPRVLPLVAGGLFAVALAAQTKDQKAAKPAEPQRDRTFAVVERSSVRTIQGSWHGSGPLLRYVHDHPGTYVVFAQGAVLYRLDKPNQMAEIQRLYAPMKELSIRQDVLAHAQEPLARSQEALGTQQRASANPTEKGRLGEAQGALGQEQGDLGAVQGELGREQGQVAKAAFRRMQAIFDQCVVDGTCTRIAAS